MMPPWWVDIAIATAILWIVFLEIRGMWRCDKCGRIMRTTGIDRAAFCARCGAPRARGDRRSPVPLVVEGKHGVPDEVTDQVRAIFTAERMAERLPAGTRATATVVELVSPGTSIAFAHRLWRPEAVPSAAGLPPFPRRPALEVLPEGIVRVDIDAVERMSGGMSSQFGFEGLYVSVLVSLPERTIWDVRAANAT